VSTQSVLLTIPEIRTLLVRFELPARRIYCYYISQGWLLPRDRQITWDQVLRERLTMSYVDFLKFCSDFGLYVVVTVGVYCTNSTNVPCPSGFQGSSRMTCRLVFKFSRCFLTESTETVLQQVTHASIPMFLSSPLRPEFAPCAGGKSTN